MNRLSHRKMDALKGKGDYGKLSGNQTLGTRFPDAGTGSDETTFIYISIVSMLIFIADVITVVILRRCRKTPIAIKYLSINFVISDAVFQVTCSLFSIVRFADFVTNILVLRISYQFTLGLTLAVSWVSVNLLAVDRLIAVALPIRYLTLVTKRRAVFVIVCSWCVNTLACSASFIWFLVDCGDIQSSCFSSQEELRGSFSNKQHFTNFVLLVLYEILNILAVIGLAIVLRRHFNRRRKLKLSRTQVNQTSTSVHRLILTYAFLQIVLHLPYLINIFLTIAARDVLDKTWRKYIEVVSHILLRVSSACSIYLYTWKLKECKYVFLSMFCGSNSKYSDTIKTLSREVYKTTLVPKM